MKYKYEDIYCGAPLIKLFKFYTLLVIFELYPSEINKRGRWQIRYSVDNQGKVIERIYGCSYNYNLHRYLCSFLQPKITELNKGQ